MARHRMRRIRAVRTRVKEARVGPEWRVDGPEDEGEVTREEIVQTELSGPEKEGRYLKTPGKEAQVKRMKELTVDGELYEEGEGYA